MNYQGAMNNHFNNLNRQVGHDVTKKYNYIIDSNDLINAYLRMKSEMGTPLMIDSKYRRAIVYNKEGLEKKIVDLINNTIISNINLLEKMVVEDLSKDINSIMNEFAVTTSGMQSSSHTTHSSNTNLFIQAISKGLVKGIGTIIDDIIFQNNKK